MRRTGAWKASLAAAAIALFSQGALADEGGVSFWLPGFFGSLAAAPLQPGFALQSMYYHTSVEAGAEVARAREIRIGRFSATLAGSVSANLDSTGDLAIAIPAYTFATPILGGQATIGLMTIHGRVNTSVDARLNASLLVGPFAFTRTRFDNISDSATGFGDLIPQFSLRWNAGVHNLMVYATGDIPVGDYDPARLSNVGLGHWTVDGGLGYTYFNPKTGHEFSAVAGFTHNFINPYTQYQNGVDFHLDWAASQFVTKQFQIGVVGYLYDQLSCDSGSGDRVGCFESRVASVGAQLGYVIPMGELQGYFNVRGYKEFEAQHRPEGWTVWLTFALSPAPPAESSPAASARAMTARPVYAR